MENQKNNSSLKAIIVVLAILLAGSLAYMYKISSDAKTTETALVKDKETAMEELSLLKTKLDAAIAEKTSRCTLRSWQNTCFRICHYLNHLLIVSC